MSDDDYRQYVARRFDLSEVTEDLSKLDGKVLALASLMRCFAFQKVSRMDVMLTQDDLDKAKQVAATLVFAGLALSESTRGLPFQPDRAGPYVIGPERSGNV